MDAFSLSETDHSIQATAVVQTEHADSTNIDLSRPPNSLLEELNLTNSESTEDDVPPPAYGMGYGEIRNEKNDFGTSARVTDDGRVDIRINQAHRRLSQILNPALRQQLQSEEYDGTLPPPYIPPSLGGQEGVPPPPSMNVVIQIVGSRGDVQPFVALGKVLKNTYGHRVRVATHANFKDFVEDGGLEFFNIGGDPSKLMAFMVKNPGLMPGIQSLRSGDVTQRRMDVAEYIQGCWRSCWQAGDGMDHPTTNEKFYPPSTDDSDSRPRVRPFVADCIIANPPSFAHIHCAEKLGIPLHIMFTMPYSPTQAFPHPLANIQSSNADPQLTNYLSYTMIELLSWQGLGDVINRFRTKCLDLDPVSLIWAPGALQRLKIPHTYCWSPALIPKPKDWGSHISISGFYVLNSPGYTPTAELQTFLDAGPPPIYIGFGSIVLENPDAMTKLIFEAIKLTGQRALVSKGWGGIGSTDIPENVFLLGNVPHDWLFQRVSCVVHHGGAGTTAAGIAAGCPTLVVPFFGDQPFWGAMVSRAGAGPDPIPHKQLTPDKLANAIKFCLEPATLERAKDLASKIAVEHGNDVGAQLFHQHLDTDRLRCVLAPSRPAAWQMKRTEIRLSAFAAATLTDAKLLNLGDLELFRAQEYQTDEGPSDPLSGGATAFMSTFGSMVMGLGTVPSETWRASIKASDAMKPRKDDANQSRIHNHDDSESTKDQDMLRRAGAHTSKGFGKMMTTMVQAPMDISLSMTKGFHNLPKAWGDTTVRPHEQVSDFKSGAKAAGKEFGFGLYDGVTGLVTQPWQGAQKEGTSGFFKGLGKGIGGFATKPGAAMLGAPAYMMKGLQKEVQKFFSPNLQHYILASRAAQGHEEWLESSEAEKQDVIARWKVLQKSLKKRGRRDVQETRIQGDEGSTAHSTRHARSKYAVSNDPEAATLSMDGPEYSPPPSSILSEESLENNQPKEAIQLSDLEAPRSKAEEETHMMRAMQESLRDGAV